MIEPPPAEPSSSTDNEPSNMIKDKTTTGESAASHQPQEARLPTAVAQEEGLAACEDQTTPSVKDIKQQRPPETQAGASIINIDHRVKNDRIDWTPNRHTTHAIEALHSRITWAAEQATQKMQQALARDGKWHATDEADLCQQQMIASEMIAALEREEERLQQRLALVKRMKATFKQCEEQMEKLREEWDSPAIVSHGDNEETKAVDGEKALKARSFDGKTQ
ncbi:hypothetical protein CERZMDRAFT_103446 [Cercospora zeae-maydis SCOH1-5]|uniref:Uncharacterized protein n=1 Tax=Cercospora zeae-maydis SCOH1-5 TaxID=717836 RepID=A0A6A6EZ20_9PEZI|nr:hypothetical protein CERZMDRAFT_103446 [Cercospora zeae-maydis SCOH1-5]